MSREHDNWIINGVLCTEYGVQSTVPPKRPSLITMG
jgi:hypothetical protein